MPNVVLNDALKPRMEASLKKAIQFFGNENRLALALKPFNPKINRTHVTWWKKVGRIPAKYALIVQFLTENKIKCWDIAPDHYPPSVFRNLPIKLSNRVLTKIYKK